jgi:hypothetical protein
MGFKNAEFDAALESAEKVAKKSCEKSVHPTSFSGEFFAHFTTDSTSASTFAFYSFFSTFCSLYKAKTGRNDSNHYKNILQLCPRIPFYIRSGRLDFVKTAQIKKLFSFPDPANKL